MNVVKPTHRVRLKVSTFGKAPKPRGDRVYKLSNGGEIALLQARGWTVEKSGRSYTYMQPPASQQGKPPFIIEIAIPTREEILQMAEQAHREGVQWLGWVGEWPAYYVPAEERIVELVEIGRDLKPIGEPKTYRTEPRFEVGVKLLWNAWVYFRDGTTNYGEHTENVILAETGYLPFGGEKIAEVADLVPLQQEKARWLPEKVLRAITERKGQTEFRSRLLAAYEGRCAITDCDAEPALEAAHIVGYAETGSQAVSNGLLLRADIHTLFDMGHVRIDPQTFTVVLSEELTRTCYRELAGRQLRLPRCLEDRPTGEALCQRWEQEQGTP